MTPRAGFNGAMPERRASDNEVEMTKLLLIFFLCLACGNLKASDASSLLFNGAKKATGIDINSGSPLFSYAKKEIYLLGILQGSVTLCGDRSNRSARPFSLDAIKHHFEGNDVVQLLMLIKAGLETGYYGEKNLSSPHCLEMIKTYEKLDNKLLNDFDG